MTSLRTHIVYNIVKKIEDDRYTQLCLDNGEERTTMLMLSKAEKKIHDGVFGNYAFVTMVERGNKYIFITDEYEGDMLRYHFLTLNDDTADIWSYVLPKFHSPHFGPLDTSAPYSFQTFLTNSWAPL